MLHVTTLKLIQDLTQEIVITNSVLPMEQENVYPVQLIYVPAK